MILSWLARFLRSFGHEPHIHFLLAALALGAAGLGLSDVVRGLPSGLIFWLGVLAIIAGWLLGRFKRLALILAPFFILAGWAAALAIQAKLLPGLVAWLRAAFTVLRQALRWRENVEIDVRPLTLAGSEISTILSQVQERLSAWMAGNAPYDQLAVGLFWTCVFWILGMWAGWSFHRWRKPMISLLPAGLIMIGSLNYASGDARYLLPFAGSLITWSALVTYKDARRHWQVDRIDYAEDIPLDFTIATSAIIVLLLLVGFLAASLPVISVQAAVRWAQEIFNPSSEEEEAVARSFGLEREKPPTYFQQLRSGELPRKHLIGAGPELSERVVMSIQVLPPPDSPQPGNEWEGWRYYWRSLTYDEYTGLGWQSSPPEEQTFQDGSIIHQQEFTTQRLVELDIRLVDDIGPTIYAAGELLTTNLPFTAAFRPVRTAPDQPDLKIDLFGASTRGEAYRVLSAVQGANLNSLRSTGDRYPDWVAQRYLALPEGIPQRVFDLVNEITRGAPTPVDKATLIEAYLRDFPYTLDLPSPPEDRDIVDYFLFDLQKGYCDYYATAMVVMARAAGIPARLAIGYASGSFDDVNRRYLVSEADAHSWSEIYFPGYGWVEFEPTGGRPAVQRPEITSFQPPSVVPPELLEDFQQPLTRQLFSSWLFWTAGMGVLALAGFIIYKNLRFRQLSPGDTIIETYRRFHRRAQPLAEPLPTGHTPLELSFNLEQWLTSHPDLLRRIPVLKRISKLARRLTDIYMRVIYSPHLPGKEDQKEAWKLWQMLQLPLHLSRFAGKLIQFKKDRP